MMFENFAASFKPDQTPTTASGASVAPIPGATGFSEFLTKYSGTSFNQGLYRVHAAGDVEKWTGIVVTAFPEYASRITCYAHDWLGRHICIDHESLEGGQAQTLLMEPGTGEALNIPVNFVQFHDDELVNHHDAALASGFYKQWLSAGGKMPSAGNCIGYKKPMFLNGADELENLEEQDMDVYWTISGQLLAKVRGLPPGTSLGSVSIS